MRFYEDILTECPKCKSSNLDTGVFDTDIEGIKPIASLVYICEDCHAKWRIILKPTKIEFIDDKKKK